MGHPALKWGKRIYVNWYGKVSGNFMVRATHFIRGNERLEKKN